MTIHLSAKNMIPTVYTTPSSTYSNPSKTTQQCTLCRCTATMLLRKLLPPSSAAGFSEEFVLSSQITRCHVPDDNNLHIHHYENFKSQLAEVCPFQFYRQLWIWYIPKILFHVCAIIWQSCNPSKFHADNKCPRMLFIEN